MSTFLRLAYDGTDFRGYARQPGMRTVQGVLEKGLEKLYKTPLVVRGASRTDSGVHAKGQVVAYEAPFEIPADGIVLGLATHLPYDVCPRAAWVAKSQDGRPVNPRFVAQGKHYRYRIRAARLRDPLSRRTAWNVTKPLDFELMREAAAHYVGRHDFAAFRAADCQAKSTVRCMHSVDFEVRLLPTFEEGGSAGPAHGIDIDIRGDAFLKHMVRIMVGTLVDVGLGRRAPSTVADLLDGAKRVEAGPTAPARGLCLEQVFWPSTWPPDPR